MGNQSPYSLTGAKLVDQGFSAIPCRPGTKRPGEVRFGEWYGLMDWSRFCDRLPTEYEVPIYEKWKDAGVCLVLGFAGVVAVDIDTDDPTISDAIMSVLPPSPVAKRGQKGRTLFYRGNVQRPAADGTMTGAIPSKAYNLGGTRVLDLLAYGRQTVLPPTIHPDTLQPYEWMAGSEHLADLSPEDLPELPDDIADQLEAVLEPFGYVAPPVRAPSGQSSDMDTPWREVNDKAMADMRWVPGLLLPKTKRLGLGWKAVPSFRPSSTGRPDHLRKLNLSFHPEGIKDFGTNEAYSPIDIVKAAFACDWYTAYEWLAKELGIIEPPPMLLKQRPRTAVALAPTPQPDIPDIPRDAVAAPRASVDPFDPRACGGILGAVAQQIADTARRPSREFAVLGAIGLCSAIFGRRYVGPSGFGLNLYLVGLAPPSFGKEHPQSVVKTIITDCGLPYLIGASVSSESAIEKIVRRDPCKLMIWDEFGYLLQGINGNKASSHAETVRKALLELYTKSRGDGIWMGKETADPNRPVDPIHAPTMSVLGFSTPTSFYEGISASSLSDGFLARLLVVSAHERGQKQKTPPTFITPPSLVAFVKSLPDKFPALTGNLSKATWRDPLKRPAIYAVPWDDSEAERVFDEVEDWQVSSTDEDPGKHGIVGRAAEQTQKLATLRAISRDPAAPRVTAEDIQWGYALVQRSLDNLDMGIARHMAGSQFESLWKAVLAAVVAAGNAGIPLSKLIVRKGVSSATPHEQEAALKYLQQSRQIEGRASAIGRPGVRYFAVSDDEEETE